MCVLEGLRKEGETCVRLAGRKTRTWACGDGLVCGLSGRCGRRCVPDQSGTCSEGFFCARGDPEGPICQPSCEGRGCPEGQVCVRQEGGVSVCARPSRFDCSEQYSCPEGLVCAWEFPPSEARGGSTWCLTPCGSRGSAPCPEDSVCHQGWCRSPCDMTRPESCSIGFCVSIDAEGHGVCLSSPEEWSAGPWFERPGR